MKIAVGNSRMDKKWKNRDITWEDFKNTVRTTKRTTETVSEFRKMNRARQDAIRMWAVLWRNLGKANAGTVMYYAALCLPWIWIMQSPILGNDRISP